MHNPRTVIIVLSLLVLGVVGLSVGESVRDGSFSVMLSNSLAGPSACGGLNQRCCANGPACKEGGLSCNTLSSGSKRCTAGGEGDGVPPPPPPTGGTVTAGDSALTNLPLNAKFKSVSIPAQIKPGVPTRVSVVFDNTGTETWTETAKIRLGSNNPVDNLNFGLVGRVFLSPGESVAPGQKKTFIFNVKPPVAGTFNFQWQMLKEGFARFGEVSGNKSVVVDSGVQAQGAGAGGGTSTPPDGLARRGEICLSGRYISPPNVNRSCVPDIACLEVQNNLGRDHRISTCDGYFPTPNFNARNAQNFDLGKIESAPGFNTCNQTPGTIANVRVTVNYVGGYRLGGTTERTGAPVKVAFYVDGVLKSKKEIAMACTRADGTRSTYCYPDGGTISTTVDFPYLVDNKTHLIKAVVDPDDEIYEFHWSSPNYIQWNTTDNVREVPSC